MVFIPSHSKNIWPGFIKPEEDEIFSSWVVRTSYEHLLKVQSFCKLAFNYPQFWSRDIDRCVQQRFMDTILEHTPLSLDEINNLFLTKYTGKLFTDLLINTNSRWVIPSGVFHRTRKRFPLLYCPSCISSSKPYFRTIWRLSLSFVCPKCKVFLRESCPHCGAPILFYRLELGKKNDFPEEKLNICFSCRKKLYDINLELAPQHYIDTQDRIFNIMNFGFTDDRIIYTHSYFDVLYSLASIFISNANYSLKYREAISKEFGLTSTILENYRYLGFCNMDNRIKAIYSGYLLLEDWPNSFISFCKSNKLGSNIFLRDYREILPFWYTSEIMKQIYTPIVL